MTYVVENSLESCRVVGHTVTYGTLALHTDELVDREILILWVCPAENSSGTVHQASGFRGSGNVTLLELERRARTAVDVALAPALNGHGSTSKDDFAICNLDGSWDVLEVDIVEDQ